jgi:Nuclease-related domain
MRSHGNLRQGWLARISAPVAAGTASRRHGDCGRIPVMPRCYPLEPGFGSGRTAERRIWEVLRDQLPADAALLHSVTMIERATEYEADLVVGWPGAGVAVIEVKGGHISRDQGQWYQSSGGETRPVKPSLP